MPHPRLTRGEGLRSRAEQLIAEQATEYLDEQPTERKIKPPEPKKAVDKTRTALTLGH